MNQIFENIKTRRSVRAYQDKPLAKEALEQIITAGLYAPSANNNQLWQLTVVQDVPKLTELQKAIGAALGNPDYHRFYGAPVLIIVSAPKDYAKAMQDCPCVLENMMLMAHGLDLGSVWINQMLEIYDEPGLRSVLTKFGVPENHQVCGCLAVGYAAVDTNKDRENKGVVVYA